MPDIKALPVKQLSVTFNKKLSFNYNSVGIDLGVTVSLPKGTKFSEVKGYFEDTMSELESIVSEGVSEQLDKLAGELEETGTKTGEEFGDVEY